MPDAPVVKGPGTCTQPDEPPTCDETGNSPNPIRLYSGRILLEERDLDIAIPGFAHSRMFLNRNYGLENWNSSQGWNWAVREWPYLMQRKRTLPDASVRESIVLKNGLYALWFDKQSDGTYACRYGGTTSYTLLHDSDNGIYKYSTTTDSDGVYIDFHDFEQDEDIAGMMIQSVDSSGYVTTASDYGFKTIGRLSSERGFAMEYAYALSGKLSDVTLMTETGLLLRRVSYIYYDGTTTEGAAGDLKAAVVQKPNSVGMTVEWIDVEARYYRYWGDSHLLKYVVGPETYTSLKTVGQDVLHMVSGSNGVDLVPEYADHYFEYDEANKVTLEVARTGEKSTGTNGVRYRRSRNENVQRNRNPLVTEEEFNTWIWRIEETGEGDFATTIYTNAIGQVLAKVQRSTIAPFGEWIEYFRRDSQGRTVIHAKPSAVIAIDEMLPDLVGKDGESFLWLKETEGWIEHTRYYSETTASSSVPGGVIGFLEGQDDQCGYNGTLIPRSRKTYIESDLILGPPSYRIAEDVTFKEEEDSPESRVTVSYSYSWFEPFSGRGARVLEKITTLPIVAVDEGGSGVAATRREFFDDRGNAIFKMDENGIINSYEYSHLNKITVKTEDVSSIVDPPAWTVLPGPHADRITEYEYDEIARLVRVSQQTFTAIVENEPEELLSKNTHYAYLETSLDSQILFAPPPLNRTVSATVIEIVLSEPVVLDPVLIHLHDKGGRLRHEISSARSGTEVVSASDSFPRSGWRRWTAYEYDTRKLKKRVRTYHLVPMVLSSDGLEAVDLEIGAIYTNYYLEEYSYFVNNTSLYKRKDPSGTIFEYQYDPVRRFTKLFAGLHDGSSGCCCCCSHSDAPNVNDMVEVYERQYDDGLAGMDSRVTSQVYFLSESQGKSFESRYDFRGRLILQRNGSESIYECDYDNLGRQVSVSVKDTSGLSRILQKGERSYNDRNQVFETRIYGVENYELTGDYISELTTFDQIGLKITYSDFGSHQEITKFYYDNLRRIIAKEILCRFDEEDEVIVEREDFIFDSASNILSRSLSKIDAGLESPYTYRRSYQQKWYDPLSRVVAEADFGALSVAPVREESIPESTDEVLVAKYEYTQVGDLSARIEPEGTVTTYSYDAKGRQTSEIKNFQSPGTPGQPYYDVNRVVQTTYNGVDKITSVTVPAVNQTTRYIYGSSISNSGLACGSLLSGIVYADGSRESFTYNRGGLLASKEDANGTIHEYLYNDRARLIHDCIRAFGQDICAGIKRRSYQYNNLGQLVIASTCSSDDLSQSYAVTSIHRAYSPFGDLITEAQEHDGKVSELSRKVLYSYSEPAENNLRLAGVVTPSDVEIAVDYGGGINNGIQRAERVKVNETTGETEIVRYHYLGADVTVRVYYTGPRVMLSLWEGEDNYLFDRFGRLTDYWWYRTTDLQSQARLEYGYDRASRRLYRIDDRARSEYANLDQLYALDLLGQYVHLEVGLLNSEHNALEDGTMFFEEIVNYDAIGNWTNYNKVGVQQSGRILNNTNQIASFIPKSSDGGWSATRYDLVGNTTRFPGVDNTLRPFKGQYDAWGQLVKVFAYNSEWDRTKTQANYYDAVGRRVRMMQYKDLGPDAGHLDYTIDFYYDNNWRVIEQYKDGAIDRLFVWDYAKNGYRDALLARFRNTGSGGLDEKLFYVQDANFNTIAVVNDAGNVVERYCYTLFGMPIILDAGFSVVTTGSVVENEIYMCGYRLDPTVPLYHVRHRIYHASLGRWLTRDPIGFDGGINLYAYLENDPVNKRDPFGLADECSKGSLYFAGISSLAAYAQGTGMEELAVAKAGLYAINMVSLTSPISKGVGGPESSGWLDSAVTATEMIADKQKEGEDYLKREGISKVDYLGFWNYECCICVGKYTQWSGARKVDIVVRDVVFGSKDASKALIDALKAAQASAEADCADAN